MAWDRENGGWKPEAEVQAPEAARDGSTSKLRPAGMPVAKLVVTSAVKLAKPAAKPAANKPAAAGDVGADRSQVAKEEPKPRRCRRCGQLKKGHVCTAVFGALSLQQRRKGARPLAGRKPAGRLPTPAASSKRVPCAGGAAQWASGVAKGLAAGRRPVAANRCGIGKHPTTHLGTHGTLTPAAAAVTWYLDQGMAPLASSGASSAESPAGWLVESPAEAAAELPPAGATAAEYLSHDQVAVSSLFCAACYIELSPPNPPGRKRSLADDSQVLCVTCQAKYGHLGGGEEDEGSALTNKLPRGPSPPAGRLGYWTGGEWM